MRHRNDLPKPWAIRAPKPEPVRVELLPAPIHPDFVVLLQGYDDGACKACGFHVHAPTCQKAKDLGIDNGCASCGARPGQPCTPSCDDNFTADEDVQRAAPAQEAAELPEGWTHQPTDDYPLMFEHSATGRLAFFAASQGFWLAQVGCGSVPRFATRAEAMAAALGFKVHDYNGPWAWLRGDDHSGAWGTAEDAAMAAIAFDAGERRRDSMSDTNRVTRGEPARDPNEIPPGWEPSKGCWDALFEYAGRGGLIAKDVCDDKWHWWTKSAHGWRIGSGAHDMHEAMRLARGLNTIAELWS